MTDETGTIYITPGMRTEWDVSKPTPYLRWTRPPSTTTQPDRLQQLWRHESPAGIKHEWRDIPIEIVAPPPPTPKEKA
jgi:hypothetical protein